MNRSAIFLVASSVWLIVIATSNTFAQVAVEKDSLVKKSQKAQAIDAEGRPIAGVSLKPFGLNTSYFWPDGLMGKPVDATTDGNGFASLDYPFLFADGVLCKSIDCMVEHVEFVGVVARLPISEAESQKVTLVKGVRFGIKGIEIDGTPAKGPFTALMSGETPPSFRQIGNDGLIETKNAATGPHQVMLVQPLSDNKTRFSEALLFHLNDRDQEVGVIVDDVELLQGIRVFGKLPSDIERPVKEGVVMAVQRPLPLKDANQL